MQADTDATPTFSAILSVDGMRVRASGSVPAADISLTLQPTELQLIYSRDRDRSTLIADGLLGLRGAGGGSVRYLDRTWDALNEMETFRCRRSIGRVQSHGNWIETRSVMENLLLPSRHHTVLPEAQLREQASNLARRFGLPGLPMQLPAECASTDLERAACIRAFLGRPALVVLEHPMLYLDSGLLPALMHEIQQVRRRNGAVIWFTEHLSVFSDPSLPAARRHQLVGTQLREVQ